jgi:hypothetical protein
MTEQEIESLTASRIDATLLLMGDYIKSDPIPQATPAPKRDHKNLMDFLNARRKTSRASKNTESIKLQPTRQLTESSLYDTDLVRMIRGQNFRNDSRTLAGRLYTKGQLYYGEYKDKYPFLIDMLTKDQFLKYWLWFNGIEDKILETHFNCSPAALKISIKRAKEKIEKVEFNKEFLDGLKDRTMFV